MVGCGIYTVLFRNRERERVVQMTEHNDLGVFKKMALGLSFQ